MAKRGRPKILRVQNDPGTPELQAKRARMETQEALDYYLAQDRITPAQHWCGMHLRWLYTLRYGAPGVTALDVTYVGGMMPAPTDTAWRSAREQEYQEALHMLVNAGAADAVLALCVYNERSDFQKTLNGLTLLTQIWRRISPAF